MENRIKEKLYDKLAKTITTIQPHDTQHFRVLRYSLQTFDIQRIKDTYYLLYNGEGISKVYVSCNKFLYGIIDCFYSIILKQCDCIDISEQLQEIVKNS